MNDTDNEGDLRAAIGPKTEYYLAHWRAMDAAGKARDWNWAACFANMFWLAYRKMWRVLGLFVLAFILTALLGAVVPSLARPILLLQIGLTFVTGAYGNTVFRRKIDGLVAQSRNEAGDPAAARAMLAARGGVSVPAVLLLVGLCVVFVVASVLAVMVGQGG